jgi:hypothetical protein
MRTYSIFFLFIVILSSCDSKKQLPVLASSNGRMNHVLFVIDNSNWEGAIGDKLKEIVTTPVVGLPQEENQFSITHVPTNSFGKMFKASRNILIVEFDTINTVQTKRNLYAKPQQVIRVTGTSEEEIVQTLETYKNALIATFKKSDIENIQAKIKEKSHPKDHYKTLQNLGIQLSIPNFFRLVEDTGDFLWLRQYLSGGIAKGDGRSNILVYAVPMPVHKNSLTTSITKMRDSIGKIHLPGSKEGMYMVTEKAFQPRVFQTKITDRTTYKTLGKWELLNDFMAGPFVNFVIEDAQNNRWIVLEGFTYAPSVAKRDYMFELEAILRTIAFVE